MEYLTNKEAYKHCEDGYACDHGDGEGKAAHHTRAGASNPDMKTQMDLQSEPMPHQTHEAHGDPRLQSDGPNGNDEDWPCPEGQDETKDL